jgi:hypothetical protein
MRNNISLSSIARKVLYEYETEDIVSDLEKEMGTALSQLTAGAKNINKVDDLPEINEALDPVTIAGLVLAAPKIVELLASTFSKISAKLNKYFNKGTQPTDNEGEIAKAVIAFSHKWHKSYIKVLRFILEVSGIFNSAKIVNDVDKNKATELLYYTLIAGMAVYSGIQGIAAFKKALMSKDIAYAAGDFSVGTFEAALAQIKAGEVKTFLNKVLK